MSLVLILALLAQPPNRDDLAMQNAVESFVIASRAKTSPPEPFYGLIERLGDRCYRCRERASGELLEASRHDLRWLMWGRRHRDPEIAIRCNAALKLATKCGCDGGRCRYDGNQDHDWGRCRKCGESEWSHGPGSTEPAWCRTCEGTGCLWTKGAFDHE